MDYQEVLLDRFRESVSTLPKTPVQALADLLEISYDAAYRRLSGRSKLSIQEAITISKEKHISLDRLHSKEDISSTVGATMGKVSDINSLMGYFTSTLENLDRLGARDVKLIYSAKDIPIFHHFNDTMLGRFKIYVWTKLLDPDMPHTPFSEFQLPLDLRMQIKVLQDSYSSYHVVELWSDTTIISTLQQIRSFYQTGAVTLEEASELICDLRELLKSIERNAADPYKSYDLYYHELLVMTNNALALKRGEPVAGFVAFAMLEYVRYYNGAVLDRMNEFFSHQIQQSAHVNAMGAQSRSAFFQQYYKRLNGLQQYLEQDPVMGF